MAELRGGNPEAAGRLVEFFYPELRRLVSARMLGERSNHTWQPTVLVNELYLELTRIRTLPPDSTPEGDARNAFFALAAFLMRRLLSEKCVLTFPSPVSGPTGTRYVFNAWDAIAGNPRTITAPASAITTTAGFQTQYFLTTSASTGGTITPASTFMAHYSAHRSQRRRWPPRRTRGTLSRALQGTSAAPQIRRPSP